MTFTESIVEQTELGWFKELRYAVIFGNETALENKPVDLRDSLPPRLMQDG